MSRLRAPSDLRMPISCVRSVTTASMMFMITIPPTTTKTETIPPPPPPAAPPRHHRQHDVHDHDPAPHHEHRDDPHRHARDRRRQPFPYVDDRLAREDGEGIVLAGADVPGRAQQRAALVL